MENICWKYVSPLKVKSAVDVLEIKYHYPLPDDLKKCILEYNAGVPSPCLFDFGENKNKVFGGLLSYNTDDLDNIYDFVALFENQDKSGLSMLPFGIDPAGNFICLKDEKIVFYDHETERAILICDTFTQFLEMLHD